MKCSVCDKEQNWLHFIGKDNVCNKCVEKKTIFKEIRFSNDKRMVIALKKRKIESFQDLCDMTEDDFDDILLTDPNIGKFKAKKVNKEKKTLDDGEVPLI